MLKDRKLWTISAGSSHSRSRQQPRYSFKNELFQLFSSITAHCYRQLAQANRSIWERLFWLLVLILEVATLVSMTLSAWNKFNANPLITTLYDTIYPIGNVPFPGISLCSNNRISRSAAVLYARSLAQRDAEQRNESYFLEQIALLGKLYDFDFENLHQMTKFQEFLDRHDVSNATGMYNALDTLSKLSPRCEDMLLRCFWKSIELPCMLRNDMIEVRRTQYGFCCTFNFVGHNEDSEIHPPPYHLDVGGPEMGLVVLLNGSTNDYFYNLFNNIGFNVRIDALSITFRAAGCVVSPQLQIFNPNEVPDITAGGVSEQFIQLGMETFVRVDAITIYSEPDVRRYSRQKRQCVFRDEVHKYGANYGRSNCVAACRIRSVQALCECVPFFLPMARGPAGSNSVTICNLQHIACLNKYKIKWSTVITELVQIAGLEKEMEESLYCPECLPACSDSKYETRASSLPLIPTHRDGFGVMAGITDVRDVGLVRIFFGWSETWLYKQSVAYYWFEMLSNFGGMFGIIGGMSLVTLVECVYFVGRQLALVVAGHARTARARVHHQQRTLPLLQ
ncbi:pickpocket protein 28 [Anopheles bellator]|uniref:pickpocket protein 28 n=1 Tax=Anopheles bellator TaxID=139047 RepID=UPI002647B8B1|nr:pickpocket protein 28 [Anopheles bellator]